MAAARRRRRQRPWMTDHEACATKVTGNVTKKRVQRAPPCSLSLCLSMVVVPGLANWVSADYSPKIFSQPPCFVCTGAFLNLSCIIPTFSKKTSATILSTKWCNSENYPGSNLNLVQSNLDRLKAILSARPFDLKSRISHYGPSRPGRKKAPHYIYYCVWFETEALAVSQTLSKMAVKVGNTLKV